MKCEKCGVNEATIHMKNIINGNVSEHHLCEECAKKDDEIDFDGFEKDFSLETLMGDLMEDFNSAEIGNQKSNIKKNEKRCSVCGMSYPEFRKCGQLGCDHCYETFRPELDRIIKKINGSSKHLGKIPGKFASDSKKTEKGASDIESKRIELENAVKDENYERAAVLRDEIKELEESRKED